MNGDTTSNATKDEVSDELSPPKIKIGIATGIVRSREIAAVRTDRSVPFNGLSGERKFVRRLMSGHLRQDHSLYSIAIERDLGRRKERSMKKP